VRECDQPVRTIWCSARVFRPADVSHAILETLNSHAPLIRRDARMSTHAGYDAAALWEILTETVRSLPMYNNHKRYVERSILTEKPQISAKEMALLMGIPLGEAIIILEELRPTPKGQLVPGPGAKRPAKSLLDYSNG